MAVNNDLNFSLAGVCPQILKAAEDFAQDNYSMNLQKSLGALDYILSPQNRSGTRISYTGQEGSKAVRAKVLYKQRSLPCEIQDGEDAKDVSICDTATEPAEKSVDVQVDDMISTTPKKFTNSNLVQICQDTMGWIREYLDSDVRAAREKLSAKVLAKIAANIGVNKHQDGTTTSADAYDTVNITGVANSQKIPLTGNFNEVLMDYQNNQFSGIPVLIGQGHLQTYFSLAGLACCNSVTPYGDALSRAGSAFYLDQNANSVLGPGDGSGDTRAIMTAFGMSHLLWFNFNTNINIKSDLMAFITVPDPVYPALSWDLCMKFDECAEAWVYFYRAAFDVFNVYQSDSFKQNDPTPACDDELFGVTGIWGYRFHHLPS
jgi:hypothetical protein